MFEAFESLRRCHASYVWDIKRAFSLDQALRNRAGCTTTQVASIGLVTAVPWSTISRFASSSARLVRKIHTLPGSSRFAGRIQDFRGDHVHFQ